MRPTITVLAILMCISRVSAECSFLLYPECEQYRVHIGNLGEEFRTERAALEAVTAKIEELSEDYFDDACHDENVVKAKYEELTVQYLTIKGHMEGLKADIDIFTAQMNQNGCFDCFSIDIHSNNILYEQFKDWKNNHPCEFIDQGIGLGVSALNFGLKKLVGPIGAIAEASKPFCSAVTYVKEGVVDVQTGVQNEPFDFSAESITTALVEFGVDTFIANKVHKALEFVMAETQDLVCSQFEQVFADGGVQCTQNSVYIQQLAFAVMDMFCGDVAQAIWKVVRPAVLCHIQNSKGSNTCGEELGLGCQFWTRSANDADDPAEGEKIEYEFYPQENTAVKGQSIKKLFRSAYCNDNKYLAACQKECEGISNCVGFVDDYSRDDRRCVLKKSTNGYPKTSKTFYTREKRGCGAFQHRKYCPSGALKTYNIGEQNLPSNAVVDYETCGALEGEAFTSCCYRFCESQTQTGCCFANDYQTQNVVLRRARLRSLAVQVPRRQCAFLPDVTVSSADIPKANVGRHAKWGASCSY